MSFSHRYFPQTQEEIKEMLKTVGASSMDDLFEDIPQNLRAPENLLNAMRPQSEIDLRRRYRKAANLSKHQFPTKKLSGAGAYRHYIPSAVNALASRGEFVTSYTPYQPEVSQGTLTAIFEYQSYLCDLTGLNVANASMYDGASSLAEAVLMAVAHTGRNKVILSSTIWPRWREVVETYTQARNVEILFAPFDVKTGKANPEDYLKQIDDKTAAVVLQTPNALGLLEEEISSVFGSAREKGAVAIQVFNPVAQALLATPAENGAQIAVAEGQPLGIPMSGGGPFLGILTAASEFSRRMPGRIVGETVDSRGRRCFVLTLQTREQHIRRERATSNICSNQALMALRATIHLSLMGKEGLRELAFFNLRAGHYARELASRAEGIEVPYDGEIFNEFAFRVRPGSESKFKELLTAAHPLSGIINLPKGLMTAAFTELLRKEDIDALFK